MPCYTIAGILAGAEILNHPHRIGLTSWNKKRTIKPSTGQTWNIRFSPHVIHRVSTACQAVRPGSKGSVSMSMVSLLASLVMAGAGCVAFAAIAVTVRAQMPAVRRLLADSRALAADREFLVQITATTAPAAARAIVRPRRAQVRLVRPVQISAGPRWRAAA
jgi:hypothetical protein